jgi:PAS domain-containing protein
MKAAVNNPRKKPGNKKTDSTLNGALIASEARYRRLFESAKDGILILDAETGMIVDVNPFLIDLLGYSKESFINKAIWDIGLFRDIIKRNFLNCSRKNMYVMIICRLKHLMGERSMLSSYAMYI